MQSKFSTFSYVQLSLQLGNRLSFSSWATSSHSPAGQPAFILQLGNRLLTLAGKLAVSWETGCQLGNWLLARKLADHHSLQMPNQKKRKEWAEAHSNQLPAPKKNNHAARKKIRRMHLQRPAIPIADTITTTNATQALSTTPAAPSLQKPTVPVTNTTGATQGPSTTSTAPDPNPRAWALSLKLPIRPWQPDHVVKAPDDKQRDALNTGTDDGETPDYLQNAIKAITTKVPWLATLDPMGVGSVPVSIHTSDAKTTDPLETTLPPEPSSPTFRGFGSTTPSPIPHLDTSKEAPTWEMSLLSHLFDTSVPDDVQGTVFDCEEEENLAWETLLARIRTARRQRKSEFSTVFPLHPEIAAIPPPPPSLAEPYIIEEHPTSHGSMVERTRGDVKATEGQKTIPSAVPRNNAGNLDYSDVFNNQQIYEQCCKLCKTFDEAQRTNTVHLFTRLDEAAIAEVLKKSRTKAGELLKFATNFSMECPMAFCTYKLLRVGGFRAHFDHTHEILAGCEAESVKPFKINTIVCRKPVSNIWMVAVSRFSTRIYSQRINEAEEDLMDLLRLWEKYGNASMKPITNRSTHIWNFTPARTAPPDFVWNYTRRKGRFRTDFKFVFERAARNGDVAIQLVCSGKDALGVNLMHIFSMWITFPLLQVTIIVLHNTASNSRSQPLIHMEQLGPSEYVYACYDLFEIAKSITGQSTKAKYNEYTAFLYYSDHSKQSLAQAHSKFAVSYTTRGRNKRPSNHQKPESEDRTGDQDDDEAETQDEYRFEDEEYDDEEYDDEVSDEDGCSKPSALKGHE
ncbi:MAG: hypothetical protein Q9218_002694 [Villophora microphyllina]